MELRESKLYKPIKELLESQGCKVYTEILMLYRCVDIAAIKDNTVVTVEMKMSLTKRVIQQANFNRLFANLSYIAIPTNPRNINRAMDKGIGIIQVKNGKALVIAGAGGWIGTLYANHKKLFIKKCLQSNNKQAGLPVLKGEGPRIRCKQKVNEYLKNNSKATWKEMYNNIPNHYSNYKSMACAIGGKK